MISASPFAHGERKFSSEEEGLTQLHLFFRERKTTCLGFEARISVENFMRLSIFPTLARSGKKRRIPRLVFRESEKNGRKKK